MTQSSLHGGLPDPDDAVQALGHSTATQPQTFRLRIELMDEGSHRYMLAETGNMKIKIRCYAAGGGENAMHAHHGQDHSFIILQGQARFYYPGGQTRDLGRNEGIMLPSGCYYCFENSGDEPLVVLRFESITKDGGDPEIRLGLHGNQINPHTPENNRAKTPRMRPNAFYE